MKETENTESTPEKGMSLPARLADRLILFYQRSISPSLGANCRFTPTCSQYAREAIKIHGFVKGSLYAAWRMLRCNPFVKGGYDPVPPKKTNHNKGNKG